MLAYKHRFHGHNSLNYVYKNGDAIRGQFMTLRYTKNVRRKSPRVAVVVSKKICKSAVGRNRIRRRLYELFRLSMQKFNDNHDVVCIVSSAEVRTMRASELNDLFQQMTKTLLD
jgi:ribonuclease P protein component